MAQNICVILYFISTGNTADVWRVKLGEAAEKFTTHGALGMFPSGLCLVKSSKEEPLLLLFVNHTMQEVLCRLYSG